MTTPLVLTLLGLGLGTLLIAGKRDPRDSMTLRERAIEAQKISARAAQCARDLAAKARDLGAT